MAGMLHIALWLGSIVPRVDDPWPHSIGLSLPFTLAGGGSVAGSLLRPSGSSAERDRISSIFSLVGFWSGTVVYALAFAYQLQFT